MKLRVVSVSGGKDSTATLLLALETNWLGDVRAVFADTGHESPTTYEYIDYLQDATGLRIDRVRADFTRQVVTKRENPPRMANGEPESAIYGARQFSVAWTPERAARAAALMVPTGNPFLNLCLLKGGFPSRKRQFCTEHLKRTPLDLYQAGLLDEAHTVEAWHGVRADESESRRGLPDYEWGAKISIARPILRWGIERVFEQHRRHGVTPNPLYSQGMSRVGCFPCINAGKSEIREIALRYFEAIERVREYERLVSEASRNPIGATFFHPRSVAGGRGVDAAVEWAKTTRGGRQYDLLAEDEPTMCSSMYGLCE